MFAYLKGSINLRLVFNRTSTDEPLIDAFADASFGDDPDDRRSTSGCALRYRGTAFIALAQKQSSVSLSTFGAEYKSLCFTSKKIVGVVQLLDELTLPISLPITIYEDNNACLQIANLTGNTTRTKYIDIAFHYTQEQVKVGNAKVTKCASADMVADIMTKPLPKPAFSTEVALV